MKQYTNQKFGALGEKYAVRYLKKNHYKILKKNYKVRHGEIDIIAVTRGADREEIVFIEVKTRCEAPYLTGQYAVDRRKQFHILRAASDYLERKRCTLQPRFDIIEVEADRATGKLRAVHHLENAFSQTEEYARF